jgi:hypothetical protein
MHLDCTLCGTHPEIQCIDTWNDRFHTKMNAEAEPADHLKQGTCLDCGLYAVFLRASSYAYYYLDSELSQLVLITAKTFTTWTQS